MQDVIRRLLRAAKTFFLEDIGDQSETDIPCCMEMLFFGEGESVNDVIAQVDEIKQTQFLSNCLFARVA